MVQALAPAAPAELVLGRYRPLRPLGSGGNGSVWLARDERTGLDVALKIVPREGKAASRAEREAEAAARLRHPACLRAYGFGRDSRHVYIAYEYVPGRTYREALRGGDLADGDAVEAAAQVLEGLAHAHARGIVHRDVKPSNVLLGDGDGARLLDFGLAQLVEAETLTAQGDVPGTLAYIAPERLAGEEATPAADVWAVGVMLWEALAGRHPFWRSSLLETARAIEDGAQSLAQLRPDLPRPLVAAVDGALALDPALRPGAAQLADELRAGVRRRGGGRTGVPALALPPGRLVPAALAAAVSGWSAAALPFYPGGWAVGLAVVAAALAFARPRAGAALALAVPVFPLGNLSLGLALVYGAAALALLAVSWREPRTALLFAAGPLLAPLAALGLVPLAAEAVRSPVRRALQAGLAVVAAAVVAGVRGAPLPFDGARPPLGLGLAGSERPAAVVEALVRALAERPALWTEALALAAVAVLAPYARARGRWWIAGLGALMLASTLLPAPSVEAAPLVVCAWLTCTGLALTRRT